MNPRTADAKELTDDEDAAPFAADVAPATPRSSRRRSRAARAFGALLALLSIWQVLSPVNLADTIVGVAGMGVSILWWIAVPNWLRVVATVGLAVSVVVCVTCVDYPPPRTHRARAG